MSDTPYRVDIECGVSIHTEYGVSSFLTNTAYSSQLINMANDIEIKLNEKFLGELRMSMYQGTYDDDVVFPLSLSHDAKEWWMSEGDGKIPTWEELVEKFFCRFYPEPYYREDEMLDEGEKWGISPLKFLSNMNTSFKNHNKINGRTQKVIFRSWMNVKWNKRYVKNSISSNNKGMESQHENSSNTALDSFFKAYDVYNIKKENG
ncbi:hypothetical protein Tco_1181205 [Tanacetum coccineum]